MRLQPSRPAAVRLAAAAAVLWLAAAGSAAAQDTVVVLHADTADYVFPVSGSQFRRVFEVDPVDSTGTFTAYASDLEDAYGHQDTVKVTRLGVDSAGAFRGRPRLRVVLEATLHHPGDYQGNVTFVAGNRRTTRFYRVSRVAAPPLVVTTAGAVERQVFVGLTDTKVWLSVHDSTRTPVEIYRPTLASLTRGGIGTDSAAVQGGSGATSTCTDSTIAANATVSCTLALAGVRKPGRYTARVRVAGPGAAAVTLPVVLYVRLAWIWAALAILLGAGISELLRQYLRSGRPRLELLRDVKRTLERIDADARRPGITSAEKEVLAALRARLAPIAAERAPEKDAGARLTLNAVEDRLALLPAWAGLRARIDRLGETDAALGEDAGARLDSVYAWLRAERSTEAEDKQAQADLNAVPAAIQEAQKKQVLAAIDAFTAAVSRERDAHPPAAAVVAVLDREVKPGAEAAHGEAEAGHLAAATAALEKARAAFARVLAYDLDERLNAYHRPDWITQENWSGTVATVRRALERVHAAPKPVDAIEAYDAARRAFLHALAMALRAKVWEELRDAAPQSEHHQRLAGVDGALGDVLIEIDSGYLPEAALALENAEQEYARIEAEHASPPRGGDVRDVEADAVEDAGAAEPDRGATAGRELPPDIPGGTGLLDLFGFSSASLRHRTSAGLDEEIGRRDRMVSYAMGAVAVALGLSLLWADAPTWGSLKDVVTAFLWGLGLHKVGTDAFGGLGALAASYAKAPGEGA